MQCGDADRGAAAHTGLVGHGATKVLIAQQISAKIANRGGLPVSVANLRRSVEAMEGPRGVWLCPVRYVGSDVRSVGGLG